MDVYQILKEDNHLRLNATTKDISKYLSKNIYLPTIKLAVKCCKAPNTGLKKTLKQGTVAGKRISGKPGQRWKKYITDIFGTTAAIHCMAEEI